MVAYPQSFGEDLARLHGKRKCDIYVVISKDGSTIMKDPGLDKAYSTIHKKLAEETAALATKAGFPAWATDLETALVSILKHPANQPDGKS